MMRNESVLVQSTKCKFAMFRTLHPLLTWVGFKGKNCRKLSAHKGMVEGWE